MDCKTKVRAYYGLLKRGRQLRRQVASGGANVQPV
jgi:hypothetical protein